MTFLRKKALRGAFSLIELLIVVAIVAVLAILGSFTLWSSTEKARSLECMMNVKTLGSAIQRYSIDHRNLLPMRMAPEHSGTAGQWHREIWPNFRHEADPRTWAQARDSAQRAGYKGWAFVCPNERRIDSATPGLSYAMNDYLRDVRAARLSGQILLLESHGRYTADGTRTQLELRARNYHSGRNFVLFGDYRIESLSSKEIPALATDRHAWVPTP